MLKNKRQMMLRAGFVLLFLQFFLFRPYGSTAFSQDTRVFSEAPIKLINGVPYSNMVYVKFKKRVIDLPAGTKKARLSDIDEGFPEVTQFFRDAEITFGTFELHKAMPDEDDAKEAIKMMNGQDFNGTDMRVSKAKPKDPRRRRFTSNTRRRQ